ncbi:MAG: pilus assembly protein TadG-related protein, partial [Bryobacteraceae bacterium]
MLLFTFCTFLLVIPMVGLAIDGSVALWTKAKLSAAVDAAALAAGRSMTSSGTFQQQQTVAEQAATNWFAANFPAGWLGTTVTGLNVSVQENPNKTLTTTVQASVLAPLF